MDTNSDTDSDYNSDSILPNNNIKKNIDTYVNLDKLMKLCKTFEKHKIELFASFMGQKCVIIDVNSFGNIWENLFFLKINEKINDFTKGPKQSSPDFYGDSKFEFELKTFTKSPGFDISNFNCYIDQLCKPNGLFRKLINTKYLIFEYIEKDDHILIKKFHNLNVWNIVSYKGKYPISMQIKKGIWYNIRPDTNKNWYDKSKTPEIFVEHIIKCIGQCPHISSESKKDKIKNIKTQYNDLVSKYTF